jgi:hypothetical protein
VQIGDLKPTHTESEKRERVPRVSTSLGHLSMSVPRVSTSLVHLTHVGPTCLTSGSHLCHVAAPHWSTSPTLATWQNTLRSPRDTWQALIGPHHRPYHHSCHMAACEWSTAAREVPNSSTQRSHLRMSVPHGSLLLVHLSHVGPTTTLT